MFNKPSMLWIDMGPAIQYATKPKPEFGDPQIVRLRFHLQFMPNCPKYGRRVPEMCPPVPGSSTDSKKPFLSYLRQNPISLQGSFAGRSAFDGQRANL